MSSLKIISGLGVLAVLFGILSSFFTVDQTQQALVLQFGEPKRLVNKPGLNFKNTFHSRSYLFRKKSALLSIARLRRSYSGWPKKTWGRYLF